MSVQWLRQRKKQRASGRQRANRALELRYGRTELREGERLMATYARDFAWCECPATGLYSGVPILPVAISHYGHVARCLACSERWIIPARRRADRMLNAYGVR